MGLGRCLGQIGALSERLVWDREAAIHAGGGRPADAFAAFCGQLGVGWIILEPRDAQAKGVLERSHRYMRANFLPGRCFANELDFQSQLDAWCDKANSRVHRTTRAVPAERLAEKRERMCPLPVVMPDADRRFVIRVAQQPYMRVDRNDYSLDPRLAGRRVEVSISRQEVTAVALDTGQVGCRHRRVFAGGLLLPTGDCASPSPPRIEPPSLTSRSVPPAARVARWRSARPGGGPRHHHTLRRRRARGERRSV